MDISLMLRNNKWLDKGLAVLFLVSLFGLLIFFFNIPLPQIGIMLLQGGAIGLFFGLLIAATFSFLNPSDWIFENRYVLEGVLWGLMFSSINFITDASETIAISSIVINLIVSIGGGILFIHFTRKRWYKRLKEKLLIDNKESVVMSASAQMTDQHNEDEKGLLVVTKDTIQFLSEDKGKLFDVKCNDAHPELTRKTWFNIPGGIRFAENTQITNVAFPQYWAKKIGATNPQ